MAVNLSARCLHHLDLPDRVHESLARYGVPGRLLRPELTESALMADPAKALIILQRLHGDGVALSIDDFGTGYSSMSYLKRLPVDELKVDAASSWAWPRRPRAPWLVRSAVELGHNLGLTVVAEGVETRAAWTSSPSRAAMSVGDATSHDVLLPVTSPAGYLRLNCRPCA